MRWLDADDRIVKLLGRHQLICLTNTGTDTANDTVIPGFTCIHALPRPLHEGVTNRRQGLAWQLAGGVALLAHNSIASRVTVLRARADMGILWVRVAPADADHRPVSIATCYIPHLGSAFYTKPGAPSVEGIWDALQRDVTEFRSAGSVMLAGDFNARVGRADDFEALTDWTGTEEHTGVAPPPEDRVMQRVLEHLPRRDSQDTEKPNTMGEQLLDLCKATGLLILNGRLPGDEQGAFTHFGPNGQVVIDYCIASPELVFGVSGRVARGCTMHITKNIARLPPRPARGGNGKAGVFDHVPVSVLFRTRPMRTVPAGQPDAQPVQTAMHTADGSHVLLHASAGGPSPCVLCARAGSASPLCLLCVSEGQAQSPRHPCLLCARGGATPCVLCARVGLAGSNSVLRASGESAAGAPPSPGQQSEAQRSQRPGDGPHGQGFKWRWPMQATSAEYAAIMQSDAIQAHLAALSSDMQGRDALQVVMDSVAAAADQLHTQYGVTMKRASGGKRKPQEHRPSNRWYTQECAQARHALRRAEKTHGSGSDQARTARKMYQQTIKHAKKEFEDQQVQAMLDDIYANPRAFWHKYKSEAPKEQGQEISLDEWRVYFHGLLLSVGGGAYEGENLDVHCAQFASLYPDPSAEAQAAAANLNRPFTIQEVETGLRRLQNNKAAGCDGLVAEFLTKAVVTVEVEGTGLRKKEYVLAPALTTTFNAVLQGGYPTDMWGVSALTPVPKPKGQPNVKDDYRGIAVGSVLAKLYALVVLARLDAWAESTGQRAHGQAGFRAGRGTPDNCFILRHVIDAAAVRKKPLYCAYIDFSKAYDRVDRDLLWRVLRGMGLHGEVLTTLQQMYEEVQMRVRAGGELSVPFPSSVGVRQGCPLSPLLFGLVIDRLERFLAQKCPDAGTRVASQLLRALLYADDVVLICDSVGQLQALLDALGEFCTANCMKVNETKSHVVIYNSVFESGGAPTHFMYMGRQLQVKPSYVYLGLRFADGEVGKHVLTQAVAKARKVMHAMFARCYKWDLHNLNAQGHLFDTLVKSVLCYGCEVWGPDWVAPMCVKGNFSTGEAEQKVHFPFMRQSLGVRKSTSTTVMMQELHREPLAFHWLRMAVQLWNKALKRPAGDYLRLAMEDSVQLAGQIRGAAAKQLWAYHFTAAIEALGCTWRGDQGLTPINPGEVQQAMRDKWVNWEWRTVNAGTQGARWCEGSCTVRAAPTSFSDGFKMFVHQQWFAQPQGQKRDSYVMHLTDREQIAAVAQLRTGSHWLMIDKGRRLKVEGRWQKLDRSARCCAHCPGRVDDEMHLLECPHWAPLRDRHGLHTFPWGTAGDADMRDVFNPTTKDGWRALGRFLVQCKYENILA